MKISKRLAVLLFGTAFGGGISMLHGTTSAEANECHNRGCLLDKCVNIEGYFCIEGVNEEGKKNCGGTSCYS